MGIAQSYLYILHGLINIRFTVRLNDHTVKIFYAKNILLGGGIGNDRRVIKVDESGLALFP